MINLALMMLEIISKLEEANVGVSLKRFKQQMKAVDAIWTS